MAVLDNVTINGARYDIQDTKAQSMVAPTESTSTASAAHAVGSYFIYDGILYRATADIAQGGTIVTSGNGKNCETLQDGLGGDVSNIKSALNSNQAAVKQVADETFDAGSNLYNILDGYIVEHLYIRTSDSKYQSNDSYTLIVIPVKVSSGNVLRFRAFDNGVFSSADFHAAVAVSYPVIGESASALASVVGNLHRGNVTLTEDINYLLINYITNNYTGTAEGFVRALTVITGANNPESYEPHYKISAVRTVNGSQPDGNGNVNVDVSGTVEEILNETVPGMVDDVVEETAVPKFLGSGNANKQLVVDPSGYVTTGETTASNIGENDVRYVPSRVLYVGSNLISGSTPASGTGWSGDFTNGFTHTSGNTDPLIIEASTTDGEKYLVTFDWTSYAENRISIGIGNTPTADPYHGNNKAETGIVSDGGYLKIYPVSSYTGTITNIMLRAISDSGTEVTQACTEVTHGANVNELTGWSNVSIGKDALKQNVNGTRDVAIGDGAMGKMISGNRNVCIGTYAMPFVTEAERNVSIGSDTLYNPSMSSGTSKAYDNVAIGKATMRNGNLIKNNIAIGTGAMSLNDLEAENNIAIGDHAGTNTSKRNVFIGSYAGYYYNGDNGVDNTAIGNRAGMNNFHNGKNNVFIGSEAHAEVSGASSSSWKTVNNSIAIGKGAKVDESYQIVIGNSYITSVKIAGKTINFNEDGTVTWT